MTDEYDYDDEGPGGSPTIQELRAQIKEQAGRLRELDEIKSKAEQADALARKVAFYEADLPRELGEAQRKAIQAIASEQTPDGFRKAAEELGFIKQPEPTVPAAELDAHDRIAEAAGGGSEPAYNDYAAEIAQAKSPEEVFAIKAKHNMGGHAVAQ